MACPPSRKKYRKKPHPEQLAYMDWRESRCPMKYRDPGIEGPDGFVKQVMWVYNNCWRDLGPVDMPRPSLWTLFKIARDAPGDFVREYVKPLMVNQTANKAVREVRKESAKVEDDGPERLDGLLSGEKK